MKPSSDGEPACQGFTGSRSHSPPASASPPRTSSHVGVLMVTPISPTTTVFDAARAYLDWLDVQVGLDRRAPRTKRNTTYGLWLGGLAGDPAERAQRGYGPLHPLAERPVGSLRRGEILAWLTEISSTPGLRKESCKCRDRCALQGLQAVLRWCADRDAVQPGIAARIDIGYQPAPGRALTLEERERLRRELAQRDAWAGKSSIRLLRVLIETGARLGELRLAQVEMLDLESGVLRLPTSKARHPRAIVLSDAAREICRRARGRRVSGWLFPSPARPGLPLTHQPLILLLQRIARRAGIERVETLTPHSLRHTFATVALERGHRVDDIAAQLGHDPATTRRHYIHRVAMPAVRRVVADVMGEGAP